MTYFADDSSVQGSQPIELFTFTSQRAVSPVVARSTSYHKDVVYGGNTFTATTIKRSDAGIVQIDESTPEIAIQVTALHPASIFFRRQGAPPQNFECLIQRLQATSGEVRQIYRGLVTEAKQNGRTVTLTVTGKLDEPLATKFPTIQVSTLCQHQLFDSLCTVSRAANQVATTISNLGDGRTIAVSGLGSFTIDQFRLGELLHIPSGERRMIADSATATTLILDVRLPTTALLGDAVTIFRACDRLVDTCQRRYNNVANFGGNPHIETTRFLWNFPGLLRHGT